MPVMSTEPYKRGLRSGLEDWRLVGPPHATRPCPERGERAARDWFLGRAHGFQQAHGILTNAGGEASQPGADHRQH